MVFKSEFGETQDSLSLFQHSDIQIDIICPSGNSLKDLEKLGQLCYVNDNEIHPCGVNLALIYRFARSMETFTVAKRFVAEAPTWRTNYRLNCELNTITYICIHVYVDKPQYQRLNYLESMIANLLCIRFQSYHLEYTNNGNIL